MVWSDYVELLNNVDTYTPNWWHYKITELVLALEIIDDAIVRKSSLDVRARKMPINIFDSAQIENKLSHHLRGKNHDVFKSEPLCFENTKPFIDLKGKSIFCGWLIPHYGHFLMETLSRLWCLNELNTSEFTFVFNYYNEGNHFIDEKMWAKELLLSFGVTPDKIIFADGNYYVERLYIPSQSLILHSSVNSKAQAYIWNTIKNHLTKRLEKTPKKVYLSRSKLVRDKRKMLNEIDVESAFKEAGFTIIYPETMSLTEQVTLMASANVVAGPSGSALHNAAFMKKDALVISLTTTDFCLLNEVLCCYAAGTKYKIFFGVSNDDKTWNINVDELKVSLTKLVKI
jgi:capsular polysaccharide biosynthesis protein